MANIGKGKFYMTNSKTHKRCPICGELKERSKFYKWASRQDGLTAYCKICMDQKTTKWGKDNHDYTKKLSRKIVRKLKFNISEEQYMNILVNQDYVCAICKNKIGEEAAVDHCHNTDKIRGLLCRNCNLGLGGFKDNIETIKKAIFYVENM